MGPEPHLQQPAHDHRPARRAPRAGVRRGADRRGDRRQGGASSASSGRCCRASTSTNVQGFGGTNFGTPRQRQQHRQRVAQPGRAGPGPEPRHPQRHDHDPRPRRRSPTSRSSSASLEQDANANILSTPTLLTLDNEEARIIVGQNIPFVTGQYATTGSTSTVHAVPDLRAARHRRDAAREAADHRGRHGAAQDLPGSLPRRVGHDDDRASCCPSARSSRRSSSTTSRSSCWAA